MAAEVSSSSRFGAKDVTPQADANGHFSIVELSGQLDAHTAPEFERFLEQLVRHNHKNNLVLDFHDLDYISSAGLGVLMGLIEEVRSAGGDMKLASLPDKIFHVLDLLGFPVVFQIFPTVEEAKDSFAHK